MGTGSNMGFCLSISKYQLFSTKYFESSTHLKFVEAARASECVRVWPLKWRLNDSSDGNGRRCDEAYGLR